MLTQLPQQSLLKETVIADALVDALRSTPTSDVERRKLLCEALVEAQAAERTALAIQVGVIPSRVWFPDRP